MLHASKTTLSILTAGTMLASVPASAQLPAPDHFRGIACIQAATTACGSSGFTKNMCAKMRFKPFGYGLNPDQTKITFNWEFFSQNFTSTGSLVGTTFRPVAQSGHNNDHYQITSQMRILTQAPANPTSARFVSGVMDINGFFPSCNIRLFYTATRLPT